MPPATVIRSLLVFDESHPLYRTYRIAKRIAIGVVGGSVLLVGIAMIILPGPAFVVILEFAWARRWLTTIKAKAQHVAGMKPKVGDPARKP
jgi:hypothetical protein